MWLCIWVDCDDVLSETKNDVLEIANKYPETFAQRDMILKEPWKR